MSNSLPIAILAIQLDEFRQHGFERELATPLPQHSHGANADDDLR